MAERYVQLMEDLQYTKRELNVWRQKHSQAQVEMEVTKEEILELKRTIQRLTQTNNRLSNDNRHLNDQKESILTEYTNEVSQIKQEIAYKQQEIIQLKELASPSKIDQQLALRQIKYDLNESFQSQISTKEQRIQELSSFIQKMKYERQIEQEKSRLKMASLQVSIIEIKKLHDQQIREYSNKVHFLQHPKTGSDKQHLKRLKRQNDQLHIQIQLLNKDLNSILQEKNKQIKDYNSYMNDYKKNVVNHSKEIEVYKEEIQRLRMKQDREMVDKNQHVVKDREREIKRLKSQIELIRDEMIDKDRKISDLQVQKVRLNNEIKLIRSERHKYEQVFEDNMQKDRQHLSGELKTAYINIDKLRAQNQELHEKIHDHSIHNNKKYQHTRQEEQPPKKTITREKQQKEQVEDNSPIKYITEMKEKNFHTTTEKHYIQDNKNRYEQRKKEYEEVILQEQGKLKEFLVKYVDLKKKNQNLEKKLTKANEKLVELLKNKIVLGSPKATTNKHFEFPQNGHQNSPPKHHEKQSKDKYKYKNLHLNTDEQVHVNYSPNFKNQVNNHNNHHTKASHHLNGSQTNQKNQYSRTNPAMIRNFLSPQQQRNILIQDNQNEHSYYDRSFKIKKSVNKLTDVKCLNHDHEHYHQEDGHRQLSGN